MIIDFDALCNRKNFVTPFATFSEIDTSYFELSSISTKSFKMIDEELKINKHKLSLETDVMNNG